MLGGMGTPGDRRGGPRGLGSGVLGSAGKGSVGRPGPGVGRRRGTRCECGGGGAISPSLTPLVERPTASERVIF